MGIGGLLRSEREKKGFSLNDVESITKIRAKYIDDLEKEDYGDFPGEIYLLGFLKNYARLLNIDPDAIVAQYRAEYKKADKETDQEFHKYDVNNSRRSAPEESKIPRRSVRAGAFWNRKLLLGVAAALVILLPIAAIIGFSRRMNGVAPMNGAQDRQPATAAVSSPERRLEVRLVDREECWVQVRVDGAQVFEDTLESGDARTFTARESVWVKLGNAGGVAVYYNGTELPPLGGEWEVVTREFTPGPGA